MTLDFYACKGGDHFRGLMQFFGVFFFWWLLSFCVRVWWLESSKVLVPVRMDVRFALL